MKRMIELLTTLLLFAMAPFALAQHAGHGGMSSGGGFGNTGHDQAMRDYQRMIKMQANDEQRSAYQNCLGSAERASSAMKKMNAFSPQVDSDSYRGQREQMKAALADMAAAHDNFARGLSQFQGNELRNSLKKLQQLQQEATSRFQSIDQELSGPKPNAKRVEKDSEKIKKALDKWRAEHQRIGRELGIES